jgi:cell division transport system permease protein
VRRRRGFWRWLRGEGADRVVPRGAQSALSVGFLAAVMAFFAVLALALALAAGRLAATWEGEIADTATLQVFAAEDAMEEQARAALNVLRTTPGVRSVRVVDLAEQERLLEPWLGPEIPMESLPLPVLIEVSTDRERLNPESLELRLAAEAPGAVFDDHAAWRLPLVATAAGLGRFGLASLGLLALALAAGLVLAAQRAVAAHAAAIRTLRLVGAEDGFIAGGFARRLSERAAAGAAAGTAAGMLLVALLPQGSEPGFFLVGIGLSGWQWLAPLLVPAAAAAIARAAASAATRASLRRGG